VGGTTYKWFISFDRPNASLKCWIIYYSFRDIFVYKLVYIYVLDVSVRLFSLSWKGSFIECFFFKLLLKCSYGTVYVISLRPINDIRRPAFSYFFLDIKMFLLVKQTFRVPHLLLCFFLYRR